MKTKYLKFIIALVLMSILFSILAGSVSAYSTKFSSDGKKVEVSFINVQSTLHYNVANNYKTGTWGYGKYTTVDVTGKDNKGRNINKKINYFNNNFRNSKIKISYGKNFLYYSEARKDGAKIKEIINGRLSSSITFKGTAVCTIGFFSGKLYNKKGSATISYYKNSIFFCKTETVTTPQYQIVFGEYKIKKITTITNTTYANHDNRTSTITSDYIRNNRGDLIGLKTRGQSQGSELIGSTKVKYHGFINIKNRYDSRDLFNEKFNSGNYYEQRTSSSTTLRKNTPLFEALLL